MARVIITEFLFKKIRKNLSNSIANKVIDLMESLEKNPKKGKEVGAIGNIIIKEIKYKKFRFYFITSKYDVKFLSVSQLQNLLIKFVNMSEKKDQDKVIYQIKTVLRNLGKEGFN